MRHGFWNLVVGMKSRLVREDGQDLVEYALLLALISVAAISSSHKVATAINTLFTAIAASLT